jgi:hypothetical protein
VILHYSFLVVLLHRARRDEVNSLRSRSGLGRAACVGCRVGKTFVSLVLTSWCHAASIAFQNVGIKWRGGGVLSHKQASFIYQLTTCFGPDRPSSGESRGNVQMVMDYM